MNQINYGYGEQLILMVGALLISSVLLKLFSKLGPYVSRYFEFILFYGITKLLIALYYKTFIYNLFLLLFKKFGSFYSFIISYWWHTTEEINKNMNWF